MDQLLRRTGYPSAEACWDVFKAGGLHRSLTLTSSWEELFNPPGFQARGTEAVLDWLQQMDAEASTELEKSFAELRRLRERLQATSLRAREAVSTAAWLYLARSRAEASHPEFLR